MFGKIPLFFWWGEGVKKIVLKEYVTDGGQVIYTDRMFICKIYKGIEKKPKKVFFSKRRR